MSDTPQLSVVVPVHNEETTSRRFPVGEIVAALRGHVDFEIVYVGDDTSKDATLQRLREPAGDRAGNCG